MSTDVPEIKHLNIQLYTQQYLFQMLTTYFFAQNNCDSIMLYCVFRNGKQMFIERLDGDDELSLHDAIEMYWTNE